MADRFETSEDAETRYEKLVSEIKRIHGELIFEQKLDGFDLKKIDFEDPHNVTLTFSYGNNEEKYELDRKLTLYHKQPLFIPRRDYDVSNYVYVN